MAKKRGTPATPAEPNASARDETAIREECAAIVRSYENRSTPPLGWESLGTRDGRPLKSQYDLAKAFLEHGWPTEPRRCWNSRKRSDGKGTHEDITDTPRDKVPPEEFAKPWHTWCRRCDAWWKPIGKRPPTQHPDEAEVEQPVPGKAYREGKAILRAVNAYERRPEARADCIGYYGAVCHVCGLRFEDRYGDVGQGYIHVHHLVPLADVGEEYVVDPIKDLLPVCPNCHAMLHQRQPPLTIEELKRLRAEAKRKS